MGMLILDRHEDEKVIITHGGERLEVVVLERRGFSVRLGFRGPRSFQVDRAEVDAAREREEEGGR